MKGSKIATYWDFIEFLDMYNIDKTTSTAAKLESGVEIKVPEGLVRFNRIGVPLMQLTRGTG